MPITDRKLRVFLCHSSQDKPIVRELYQRLNASGWIDPWLDEEKLLPGQDWDMEITQSLLEADAVIVCLSKSSLTKDGYIQKEINNALEKLKEKPEGTNYFIPVRLEECEVPTRFSRWQYVDYFSTSVPKKRAFNRVLASLSLRSTHLGLGKSNTLPIEKALIKFGQEISSTTQLQPKQVLEFLAGSIHKFININNNNIFISLCDERQEFVKFEVVYENGKIVNWEDKPISEGLVGEIVRSKKPIYLPTRRDIMQWYKKHPNGKEDVVSTSWLAVPMLIHDYVLGVTGVYNIGKEGSAFQAEDAEILQTLANQTAVAYENSRLYNTANIEIQAQKQLNILGRAMAAIEHRINNTLNIIAPNINRLRKRVNIDDPEIKDILEIIERNTRYTSLLIDRIRTFSLDVDLVDVNINTLLAEIITVQKADWATDSTHIMKIEPDLEFDLSIPPLRLPLSQISEVFINLIQNAYKNLEEFHSKQRDGVIIQEDASPEMIQWKAKLIVISTKVNGKVKIRVKDNVPGGIPIKIGERLFKRPVPSQTPGVGSGLGLWLSKLIMNSVGGDIGIENTGMSGTSMSIEFPIPEIPD